MRHADAWWQLEQLGVNGWLDLWHVEQSADGTGRFAVWQKPHPITACMPRSISTDLCVYVTRVHELREWQLLQSP